MSKGLCYILNILLLSMIVVTQPLSVKTLSEASGLRGYRFVRQIGPELRLNEKKFRFAGSNNYYLMYKSQFMVDDVLTTAASNDFRVMRIWGSLEIGNQDGSNSIQGKADGVYFQYWDGSAPAYNDGDDGLKHLDYVVYKAGQLGIRLVIPFVNNWNAFGGMDQYVRWRGGQYHDQFYTDPLIRTWYKNWIAHLLNHTNFYTGVKYKDDPTIMTWELANEPRCLSAGVYPRSDSCTTKTLIEWADEVSRFVKNIDPRHLVSVGDEGFYCAQGATDWTENCGEGVDTIALTSLPQIDVMSFHLYPDSWGKDATWGTAWIQRHFQDARKLRKPAMLGEFGLLDKSVRNLVYKEWTDAVLKSRGSGALYWILSGKQEDGSYYADYDGYTVYCPSPVCITISNFAKMMIRGRPMMFPPVADHDAAVTEFNTPVTLTPSANDIAYCMATLLPGTIDLDPSMEGQQTVQLANGGSFKLQSDYTVLFTPSTGFTGKSQISYTIQDSLGQLSNPADIVVTVKPGPSGLVMLFSFETGTEGWAPAIWQANAGTVAQSVDFHTDGNYSLQINAADGGWFGLGFATPMDLTGKTHLKIDIKTSGTGTSQNIAIQTGDSYVWCQSAWYWINLNTSMTADIDLLHLSCSSSDPANISDARTLGPLTPSWSNHSSSSLADLSKVQGMYVWFSGGGTFYMDAVRAE